MTHCFLAFAFALLRLAALLPLALGIAEGSTMGANFSMRVNSTVQTEGRSRTASSTDAGTSRTEHSNTFFLVDVATLTCTYIHIRECISI